MARARAIAWGTPDREIGTVTHRAGDAFATR
jgi:hypothetical protein